MPVAVNDWHNARELDHQTQLGARAARLAGMRACHALAGGWTDPANPECEGPGRTSGFFGQPHDAGP